MPNQIIIRFHERNNELNLQQSNRGLLPRTKYTTRFKFFDAKFFIRQKTDVSFTEKSTFNYFSLVDELYIHTIILYGAS